MTRLLHGVPGTRCTVVGWNLCDTALTYDNGWGTTPIVRRFGHYVKAVRHSKLNLKNFCFGAASQSQDAGALLLNRKPFKLETASE